METFADKFQMPDLELVQEQRQEEEDLEGVQKQKEDEEAAVATSQPRVAVAPDEEIV